MLYFFYGSDRDSAREKAGALTDSLLKKKPEAEVFRLDQESWDESRLQELTLGQGLFNNSYIVQIAGIFENKEIKEAYLARLSEVAKSPNVFIQIETAVDKKSLLEITEVAEKVQLFEDKESKKTEFNIFSLTDAFGRRDKRKLWVLYRKAVDSGAVPEEIHGILFWQLKSILLAASAKSAEEAGVKPFVWSKAKSFAKNYTPEELKKLSQTFVKMYHDSHRGIHDFEIALERFVLSI